MPINQVLIATQFDSAITTDGFESITRAGVVKRTGIQIQHTIIEALILQDLFFPRLDFEKCFAIFGFNKVIIIEETFVNGNHVNQY